MSLVAPEKVFRHLDRLFAWQRGSKPAPVTVEWDLSNRCSLGCQFCHFAHTHTRGPWAAKPRDLTVDAGDLADPVLVMRVLPEMAEAGVRGIVWSGGGEPTLHPAFGELVYRASRHGFQQGLYTHGGHVTPAMGAALAAMLTWAVVSLDAADAATYAEEKGVDEAAFTRACDGVRHLAASGRATIGVSFLIHADNWKRMDDMLALGRALGATYVTFRPTILTSPVTPPAMLESANWVTCARPTLLRLADEPDVEVRPERFLAYRDWVRHPYPACHGIKLHTTITPDGRVWLCPNRRGQDGAHLGHLQRESFGEIWARHPGQVTDFSSCRVMCRLHEVNQALSPVFAAREHEAFV